MANNVRKKIVPLTLMMLLAGCTASHQPAEQDNLRVEKQNAELQQQARQTLTLAQQNSLNATPAQGAWLLPSTNTGVVLQSQAGEVRLSLSHVESEANGTRATLHVRAAGDKPLPAFNAQIEWGEMDNVTGKPLQVNSQSQAVSVADTLLPRSEVAIPLRLSNLSPEQLGYVRVHDIVVHNAAQAATAP